MVSSAVRVLVLTSLLGVVLDAQSHRGVIRGRQIYHGAGTPPEEQRPGVRYAGSRKG